MTGASDCLGRARTRPRRLAGSRRHPALLEAYGIPVVDQRVADTPDEAAGFATQLGFPVVVKTAVAGAHKTESGGVVLDLQSEDDVREAAARIGGPVLVQPMRSGSAELLAGLVQDELFGPLIALGPGGVLAELIGDAGSASHRSQMSTRMSSCSKGRQARSCAATGESLLPTQMPSPTSSTALRTR